MDKEAYQKNEDEITLLIEKKKALDAQIAGIEVSIYGLETAYLDETPYGNIVKVLNALNSLLKGIRGIQK